MYDTLKLSARYCRTQLPQLPVIIGHCISQSILSFIPRLLPGGNSEQSGAVEACWAHNPEVGGSKPLSASYFVFLTQHLIEHHCLANLLPIPY